MTQIFGVLPDQAALNQMEVSRYLMDVTRDRERTAVTKQLRALRTELRVLAEQQPPHSELEALRTQVNLMLSLTEIPPEALSSFIARLMAMRAPAVQSLSTLHSTAQAGSESHQTEKLWVPPTAIQVAPR